MMRHLRFNSTEKKLVELSSQVLLVHLDIFMFLKNFFYILFLFILSC